MILQLRDLLRSRGQMPLKELCAELNCSPECIRPMLALLIRKGQIKALPQGSLCAGGCRLCPPESVEIFRWIADNSSSKTTIEEVSWEHRSSSQS